MTERTSREIETLTIRIPIRLQRRRGRKLIMRPEGVAAPARNPSRDETLVKSLVRAHRWRRRIGETDRRGVITKASDARARVALFEAAHVMMTRVTRWFPLKAWAMRVAARRGAKRAKVALARKLAVILHRIWIDGTDFQAQPA